MDTKSVKNRNSENLRFTFTNTEDDLLAWTKKINKFNTAGYQLKILVILAVLDYILVDVLFYTNFPKILIVIIFAAVFVYFYFVYLRALKKTARTTSQNTLGFLATKTAQLGSKSLTVKSEKIQSEILYSGIVVIEEDDNYYYVKTSERQAIILPKRDVTKKQILALKGKLKAL